MHTPAFRIVVYATIAPDQTPETAHYVAGLFIGYGAARWHCSGATADEARTKMETFWAEERKSHEPRKAPKKGQPSRAEDALDDPDNPEWTEADFAAARPAHELLTPEQMAAFPRSQKAEDAAPEPPESVDDPGDVV